MPSSAAIGTDVYDEFLEKNRLHQVVAQDLEDNQIAREFLKAKLPKAIMGALNAFLKQVRYPLAVRSSSLLEDSQGQPFAGVYTTHMIPNNNINLRTRRKQLCDAIKLVYASTFFKAARRYLEATGRHSEEEKMGVILQELVGSDHNGRFYPNLFRRRPVLQLLPHRTNVTRKRRCQCSAGFGKDGGRGWTKPDVLATAAADLTAVSDHSGHVGEFAATVLRLGR